MTSFMDNSFLAVRASAQCTPPSFQCNGGSDLEIMDDSLGLLGRISISVRLHKSDLELQHYVPSTRETFGLWRLRMSAMQSPLLSIPVKTYLHALQSSSGSYHQYEVERSPIRSGWRTSRGGQRPSAASRGPSSCCPSPPPPPIPIRHHPRRTPPTRFTD